MSQSTIMRKEEFYTSEGILRITDKGYSDLYTLCEIVLNTHYSYVLTVDREDLISVGIIKSLSLLEAGGFDATKSSLKNYLYTGIRNEMKNYLYKNRRDIVEDDEILTGINEDKSVSVEDNAEVVFVSQEIIQKIVERIREADLRKVCESLTYMGFDVGPFKSEYHEEMEGVLCLILWEQIKIKKNYQEY